MSLMPFDPRTGAAMATTPPGAYNAQQLQAAIDVIRQRVRASGAQLLQIQYYDEYDQQWCTITGQVELSHGRLVWRDVDPSTYAQAPNTVSWPVANTTYAGFVSQNQGLTNDLHSALSSIHSAVLGLHHVGASVVDQLSQTSSVLQGINSLGSTVQSQLQQQEAALAGLHAVGTTVENNLQQSQAALQGLHHVGSSVTQQLVQSQAALHGLQSTASTVEGHLQQVQGILHRIETESRQLQALRDLQRDEEQALRTRRAELTTLTKDFADYEKTQRENLAQQGKSEEERKTELDQLENRLTLERAQLRAAENTLSAKAVELQSVANEVVDRECALRLTRLTALSQGVQHAPAMTHSATQARPQEQYRGQQTGPSLQSIPRSLPPPPPHPAPAFTVPCARSDDFTVSRLQEEVSRLKAELVSARREDVSSAQPDDVATDDEDESSCAFAIGKWTNIERVLQPEDRFGEPLAALTLSRSKLESDWRRYLRGPSTALTEVVEDVIVNLLMHYDACKTILDEGTSARAKYTVLRLFRASLYAAHKLRLTLGHANVAGYGTFADAARTARIRNRSGKVFETMSHVVTKVLTTSKNVTSRGGHRDERKSSTPARRDRSKSGKWKKKQAETEE